MLGLHGVLSYVMNLVYVGCLLCGKLWNEQWRVPCSFSQCVGFFFVVVGKMAQDVGMV